MRVPQAGYNWATLPLQDTDGPAHREVGARAPWRRRLPSRRDPSTRHYDDEELGGHPSRQFARGAANPVLATRTGP